MGLGNYILDEAGNPVKEPDLRTWAMWMNNGERRRVKREELADGAVVSTVFFGIDHRFGDGPPLVYETLVFTPAGGEGEMRRYTTRDEALAGHEEVRIAYLASQGEC